MRSRSTVVLPELAGPSSSKEPRECCWIGSLTPGLAQISPKQTAFTKDLGFALGTYVQVGSRLAEAASRARPAHQGSCRDSRGWHGARSRGCVEGRSLQSSGQAAPPRPGGHAVTEGFPEARKGESNLRPRPLARACRSSAPAAGP